MQKPSKRILIASGIWFASLFAVVVSILHFFPPPLEVAIANNFGPSPAWFPEQMPRYREHWLATLLHIIPGALLLAFAPLQLNTGLRSRNPSLHRWIGRLFVLIAIPMALAAMFLAWTMPFGGNFEKYTMPLVAAGFLYALWRGVYSIRHGDKAMHRLWMSHMLAIAYAPMTMRFILLITAGFGVDGQKIFGEAMLIGVAVNLAFVRLWMRSHPVPRNAAASLIQS